MLEARSLFEAEFTFERSSMSLSSFCSSFGVDACEDIREFEAERLPTVPKPSSSLSDPPSCLERDDGPWPDAVAVEAEGPDTDPPLPLPRPRPREAIEYADTDGLMDGWRKAHSAGKSLAE